MKKTFILIAALSFTMICICLTACNKQEEPKDTTAEASMTASISETETETEADTQAEISLSAEASVTSDTTMTKAPVITVKPTATKAPVTTVKPATTKAPAATAKPATTKAPVATVKPTTTKAPVTTVKPTTTKAPVTTVKPTTTKAPVTTAKPTTTANSSSTSQYESEVIRLVNEERKKAGLNELQYSSELYTAAQIRKQEIATKFSHTRPNGQDCFSTSSAILGENIAAGQQTPQSVMSSWMGSSGHRANIMNSNFTSIAVGCYYNNANGTYYWVQLFG